MTLPVFLVSVLVVANASSEVRVSGSHDGSIVEEANMEQGIEPEQFAQEARRTLFFARSFVSEVGGSSVAPEHLVLGLLRGNPEAVQRFLAPGSSPEEMIRELKSKIGVADNRPSDGEMVPVSIETIRILREALSEASSASKLVHPEHILLALLRTSNVATDELRAHGVNETDVRAYLQKGNLQ